MKTYSAVGLMSGSSLDGVDLALCTFTHTNGKWAFVINKAVTYPYPEEWKLKLSELPRKKKEEIEAVNIDYGQFLGHLLHQFLKSTPGKPDLIASHGHTVFHNPEKGYTLQIGDGQAIADATGIMTINNFRQKDIDLGGQGAPLVPMGDELLFGEYDYCLNIGGIANISFNEKGQRKAFDVCPANQLLNYLSRQLGAPYDAGGTFAQLGKLNKPLFEMLNSEAYYNKKGPKSLSKQYVMEVFGQILDSANASVEDKLYTVVKHIAWQVKQATAHFPGGEMLVTGGGAHNHFLVKAIELESGLKIRVPAKELTDFKEALIFALLGVLRLKEEINCYASVTGARKDSYCGEIHLPGKNS